MKNIFAVFFVGLLIGFCSCSHREPYSAPPLIADLTDGPWQLTSTRQIDNNGSVIKRSNGMPSDSIIFKYSITQSLNMLPANILDYFNDSISNCNYKLALRSLESSNIYDTILCSQPLRYNYTDTLFVTSYNDYLMVFQVRLTGRDSNITEIDSLKKMRFW